MMAGFSVDILLKSLLHHLGSDVIAIDREGLIVYWERGFAGAGDAPAGMIGRHLLDVFPQMQDSEGGIDWNLEIFKHVLDEGRSVEVRRQARHVGDRTFWFDILAWPLKDGEGDVVGAVLASLDISERQALEDELIRTARTQSLANLGASIAHEIRNPLNAMSLNLQLVREGLEDPDRADREQQLANIDLALEEITRLDGIVSNFLQFARPPQTQLSLDDPNDAVRTVISMLNETARKKGVELVNASQPVPEVLMDRNRIIEAIFNLAQNAIQAMEGGGTVTLGTLIEPDSVLIQVADDGPGIPEEMHDKIFELYFSTKEEDGTGLGLPYADSLIKAHQGQLTMSSEPGQGTTFTIRLPRSIRTGTAG